MNGRITIVRTMRRKLENTEVTVVYSGEIGKKTGYWDVKKDVTLNFEEAKRICSDFANKEQPLYGYDELEFECVLNKNGETQIIHRIEMLGSGYKGKTNQEKIREQKEDDEKSILDY